MNLKMLTQPASRTDEAPRMSGKTSSTQQYISNFDQQELHSAALVEELRLSMSSQ